MNTPNISPIYTQQNSQLDKVINRPDLPPIYTQQNSQLDECNNMNDHILRVVPQPYPVYQNNNSYCCLIQ